MAEQRARDAGMAVVCITRLPLAPMAGGKPWRIVLDKVTVGRIGPTDLER